MTEIRRSEIRSEWANATFDADSVLAEPMSDRERTAIRQTDRDGDGHLVEEELDAMFARLDEADGRPDGVATLEHEGAQTGAGRLYDPMLLTSVGGTRGAFAQSLREAPRAPARSSQQAEGSDRAGAAESILGDAPGQIRAGLADTAILRGELGPPPPVERAAISRTAKSGADSSTSKTARSHELLRDPARCEAMLERHRERSGVPPHGFRGQVDLEQGGRPRLSWTMVHLRSESGRHALERNLARTDDVFTDRALLLAVTSRERCSAWTVAEQRDRGGSAQAV
jgi:hypothetical protein